MNIRVEDAQFEDVQVRKATSSEIAKIKSLNYVDGKGFVRYGIGNAIQPSPEAGVLGLPQNPRYNSYLSRDLSTLNFTEEGYRRNSIVAGLIVTRQVAIQQAELNLFDVNDTEESKPIDDCPFLELLERPNELFDFGRLIGNTEGYTCIGGQSYWHKVRNAYGQVIALFPYHASQIKPMPSPASWITVYRYDNGAGFIMDLPPYDVVPFLWPTVDPVRPWMAISPLAAIAGEIDVDNQRKELEYYTLMNGAVPAVVFEVGPSESGRGYTQAQLDILAEKYAVRQLGKNRGKSMFGNTGTKAHVLGFSPKELSLSVFAELPETRAAQVLGVPMQMTSFSAAKFAKTYKNYGEARRSFYVDTMQPTWLRYAKAITHAFKDELFQGDKRQYKVKFDAANVFLSDTIDPAYLAQVVLAGQGKYLLPDEVRSEFGWEPLPDGSGSRFAVEPEPTVDPEEETARMRALGNSGHGKILQDNRKKVLVPMSSRVGR